MKKNAGNDKLEKSVARSYGWAMKNVVEAIAKGNYKRNPNSTADFRAKMKKWKEETENGQ